MGTLLDLRELSEIQAPVNAIVYDPSHLDRVGGSSICVLSQGQPAHSQPPYLEHISGLNKGSQQDQQCITP